MLSKEPWATYRKCPMIAFNMDKILCESGTDIDKLMLVRFYFKEYLYKSRSCKK